MRALELTAAQREAFAVSFDGVDKSSDPEAYITAEAARLGCDTVNSYKHLRGRWLTRGKAWPEGRAAVLARLDEPTSNGKAKRSTSASNGADVAAGADALAPLIVLVTATVLRVGVNIGAHFVPTARRDELGTLTAAETADLERAARPFAAWLAKRWRHVEDAPPLVYALAVAGLVGGRIGTWTPSASTRGRETTAASPSPAPAARTDPPAVPGTSDSLSEESRLSPADTP